VGASKSLRGALVSRGDTLVERGALGKSAHYARKGCIRSKKRVHSTSKHASRRIKEREAHSSRGAHISRNSIAKLERS
jgi:hypothetical protein